MVARHIPGYNYCGPGTSDFGARPRNALDACCRKHDLAYTSSRSVFSRLRADRQLMRCAQRTLLNPSSSTADRASASIVIAAMMTAPGAWYRG